MLLAANPLVRARVPVLMLAASLSLLVACGGTPKNVVPPGTQPDRFLYDRGTADLTAKRWMTAREYFQRIIDGYPQSTFRPDAKLAIGDTYLGENTAEALVFAAGEFREFLQFYPTHARADYAQYKLAMSHYQQMRAPERDQTETRAAVREFEAFFERYPQSALTPEVRTKWRDAKDRLVFKGTLAFGESKVLDAVAQPVRVQSSDGSLQVRVDGVDRGALGRTGRPAQATFVASD